MGLASITSCRQQCVTFRQDCHRLHGNAIGHLYLLSSVALVLQRLHKGREVRYADAKASMMQDEELKTLSRPSRAFQVLTVSMP